MRFDRETFFHEYRIQFGKLRVHQVKGLNSLLSNFEKYYGWWSKISYIANAFAQIGWETNDSYLPVAEGYYLKKGVPKDERYYRGDYDSVRRWQEKNLRYHPYHGRGHIQLTWKSNYVKHSNLLRKYFPELQVKGNLADNPELLFDPDISFAVMTIGMHKGTFRSRSLHQYFKADGTFDHFNARSIVNGDKNYRKQGGLVGSIIFRRARKFELILKASLIDDDEILEIPTVVDEPSEEPTEPTTTPPEPSETPSTDDTAHDTPDTSPPVPPPEQPKQFWVEDLKPFVKRWTWKIWGVISGINTIQIPAALTASANNPEYAPYFLTGGGVILGLTVLLGLIASVVLGVILWRNRLELERAFHNWIRNESDPSTHNYELLVEKK